MPNIEIKSIVSGRDLQPYVQVEITSDGATGRIQLTPEDAIEQAIYLISAAEAAQSDHFLITFLREKVEIKTPAIMAVLEDFRKYREQREFHPRTQKMPT
jgi:hypothetical protein